MTNRKVFFVQVSEPAAYPPLINAAHLLSHAGWSTIVLSAPSADKELKFPEIPRLLLETISKRPNHVVTKAAFAAYCSRAVRIARRYRPELVYASDPIGALPGLLAARSCGEKLIYLAHDSPNSQRDLNPIVRMARRAAVRAAYRVIFPNLDRAQHAGRELNLHPERLIIAWNMPRRSEVATGCPAPKYPFVLYYHGSITPDRVPESVAEAVSVFGGRVRLRIAGYETESGFGYVRHLIERFKTVERGGFIEAVGQISREHLLRHATQAHAGLALMPIGSDDVNMRYMTGASNKAFDYMASGLPLVVSDLPDWRSVFVEPGYAIAADPRDSGSLVWALRELLETPQLRISMGERNRSKILADWNYETALRPLLFALS